MSTEHGNTPGTDDALNAWTDAVAAGMERLSQAEEAARQKEAETQRSLDRAFTRIADLLMSDGEVYGTSARVEDPITKQTTLVDDFGLEPVTINGEELHPTGRIARDDTQITEAAVRVTVIKDNQETPFLFVSGTFSDGRASGSKLRVNGEVVTDPVVKRQHASTLEAITMAAAERARSQSSPTPKQPRI